MISFKHINKEDREKYCQALSDLESGNHLIHYRDKGQLKAIHDIVKAERAEKPTKRQYEILEWIRVCSDYNYAKDNGYIDAKGHFIDETE